MDSPLVIVARLYRDELGDEPQDQGALRELYGSYEIESRRPEDTLMETAAAAAGLQGILLNDRIEWNSIPEPAKKALELATDKDPVEFINDLNNLPLSGRSGFVSPWKGKLFEVLLNDKLNNGETVGPIQLGFGQMSQLATNPNQPGWDLVIKNADGTQDFVLQAKATQSLAYVKEALERYPDIQVVATSEVAERLVSSGVVDSGITESTVRAHVEAAADSLDDNILEDVWEKIGPVVPFGLIVLSESGRWLVGQQTFKEAIQRSFERGVKQLMVMGLGTAVAALPGPNILGMPTVVLTRMSLDRYSTHRRILTNLARDTATIKRLNTIDRS